MSQYQPPPPQDPLPYYAPAMPRPKLRPTSVTVVAIISIVLGSLGMLGTLCSIPQYLGVNFAPNPVMDQMRQDAIWMGFTVATLAVGVILCIFQLWGGIGILSLKKSALKILNTWAIAYIAVSVISIVVNVMVVMPRIQNLKFGNAAQQAQMQKIMQYGQLGGVCMAVLCDGWAVLIIYLLSRPHVKAAFDRGMVMPPAPIGGPEFGMPSPPQ